MYISMCMGKNINGHVYCRLINATVLYLLTTELYVLYSTLTFYGRYTVFVFDAPMQNTISIVMWSLITMKYVIVGFHFFSAQPWYLLGYVCVKYSLILCHYCHTICSTWF